MILGHPWGTLATVRALNDLMILVSLRTRDFIGFLRLVRPIGLWEIARGRIRNARGQHRLHDFQDAVDVW